MNKKGFVLLETLIVTVFVLFIFTILYNSVVPLLGRYEELSYYDDIDTTYQLYHIKKLINSDSVKSAIVGTSDYTKIECSKEENSEHIEVFSNNQAVCYSLYKALDIDTSKDEVLFINKNYINTLKDDSTNSFVSEDTKDYLKYINPTSNILVLQNDGYLSYVNLT